MVEPVLTDAADFVWHDLRRKPTGERATDRYFREASKLAGLVVDGGFDQITGVPREQILMPYSQ